MSSEVLISTDHSVQMSLAVFGFCQTFNVTFQGKHFWKKRFIGQKFDYFSRSFFLNSVTFGVISGIKCYQFNEFDVSLITLKYYTVRFF